jgi:hypothetical protein|nr:MAG TPA: hypothetical protein [Caudoviricetes sp.]
MIYQSNNVYYLKKANDYEIANLEIKYNSSKKKNVLVVIGTGVYVSSLKEPKEYNFKELEKKLCEKE